jgi:hypothetical protein
VEAWVPPGWPGQVRPPGAEDWHLSAVGFLFDCCPPDYRSYSVLRRHPIVLARFAITHLDAQLEANTGDLARLRTALAGQVSEPVVGEALAAWSEQGAKLVRLRREAGLVADALRGVVFRPRL